MNFFSKTKVQIMGILNVTPDSFSDGGEFEQVSVALNHTRAMVNDGANIIDLGAQSTRPGYQEVPAEIEIKRLTPVIKAIRAEIPDLPLSIDTYFPEVARTALKLGANIINDVHGFSDPEMFAVMNEFPDSNAIIMHGVPQTNLPLKDEIKQFYQEKLKQATQNQINFDRLCFDPGVGWKNEADTMDILQNPQDYSSVLPILIGVSRKRIIKTLTGEDQVKKRDLGSIITSLRLAVSGQVNILRVHDVRGMGQALNLWKKLVPKAGFEL